MLRKFLVISTAVFLTEFHTVYAQSDLHQRYELKGVVHSEGTWKFSIYDKTSTQSWWQQYGREYNQLTLLSYDLVNKSLELKLNDIPFRLKLQSPLQTWSSPDIIVSKDVSLETTNHSTMQAVIQGTAKYLRENQLSDVLDSPLPSTIRQDIHSSRMVKQSQRTEIASRSKEQLSQSISNFTGVGKNESLTGEGKNESLKPEPYHNFERAVRLERRRQIRQIKLDAVEILRSEKALLNGQQK